MDDVIERLSTEYQNMDWKPFPESDKYVVSSTGLVFSRHSNRLLKPYNITPKYLGVDVGGKSQPLHRVVATTFIPNTDGLEEVHHKNHDTFDNRVDNLAWISKEDNLAESSEYYGKDLTKPAREALRKVVFKRVTKVDLITGEELETFDSVQDAQEAMGKPRKGASISRVANGQRKSAYGYFWKWADSEQANRASKASTARLNSTKISAVNQYTLDGELLRTWKNFYWPETEFPELRADGIEASFSSKKTDRSKLPVTGKRVGYYKGFVWVEE